MERITIPTSDDTRGHVVLTAAEAAALGAQLRQALDWQPNSLTRARCAAAVATMRAGAEASLGLLNAPEADLLDFFGPEGGAFAQLLTAWDDAPLESQPGYGETTVRGSNLIRRYPGGKILTNADYQVAQTVLRSWQSLRTGGCGVALGGPLAILGGAALAAGLYLWWRKNKKARAA